MRLKQRRNVLLPQPEGPINALTWFSGTSSVMLRRAWFRAVPEVELARGGLERGRAPGVLPW
jgi:hypothetical protein